MCLYRGRKQRPWKSRVAVVHTWRNLRGRSRCTFEEVEKELHAKDQEDLDQRRDPEEPHRQASAASHRAAATPVCDDEAWSTSPLLRVTSASLELQMEASWPCVRQSCLQTAVHVTPCACAGPERHPYSWECHLRSPVGAAPNIVRARLDRAVSAAQAQVPMANHTSHIQGCAELEHHHHGSGRYIHSLLGAHRHRLPLQGRALLLVQCDRHRCRQGLPDWPSVFRLNLP